MTTCSAYRGADVLGLFAGARDPCGTRAESLPKDFTDFKLDELWAGP